MDFAFDEDQRMIQQAAREFAARELAPAAQALDRAERFPRERLGRLAELGFLGLLAPARFGGTELGDLALFLVLEELNRACAATGVAVSVHNSLVCGPLVRHGTAAQQERYLPELVRGERIGAYALTEPEHGSDAAAIETRAERRGDRYVLNGRKAWITNAPFAGLVVVFATLDPARRGKGITAFLVEPSWPGFAVGRHERKMGIRGCETAEVVLEDVEVPVDNRLGAEGEGFKLALDALNAGRIGIAAQGIGIAGAALEASRRYARERRQFGRPIAEFQAVQWKLARMALGIESARLLALRAAWRRDRGMSHTQEAAMAKLSASEVANAAATDAVQIHGGAGYCCDFPVERYFRDAKITEIYEGTSEIQHLVIARGVLEEAP
jgi:alkylation response protein AidB-like acyl-CoA dehydrogenase